MNADPNEDMKLLAKEEGLELQQKIADIDVQVMYSVLITHTQIHFVYIKNFNQIMCSLFFPDSRSHFTSSCHYSKRPQHVF
jgi:hypothetical protein